MYRLALCTRYVMSRFLTLVATVAVFLAVGVLVVVMAVMGGFTREVRSALRGGLSDVIIATDVSGMAHYDEFIAEIKKHPNVAEATPVIQLFGLVRLEPQGYGSTITKPCFIFGVHPGPMSRVVSRFGEYLERQKQFPDREPTFDLPADVAQKMQGQGTRTYAGCIPGSELVSYVVRDDDEEAGGGLRKPTDGGVPRPEVMLLTGVGAKVVVTTLPVTASGRLGREGLGAGVMPVARPYTVVDHYKSRLFEFDSRYLFIPFEEAQKLGELGDLSGTDPEDPPRAHQVQVSLRDYGQAEQTVRDLRAVWRSFASQRVLLWPKEVTIRTWEQEKATTLSIYQMQFVMTMILLSLVMLVAGFLIGAILTMIVKEKTRDIGILKCLGASNVGVAQIFLFYAVMVSSVGALLGLLAGKYFIFKIDTIEAFLSRVLGIDVFPRAGYFFDSIPRYEDPWLQALVVAGAIFWAVLCGTIAAWRASRLQPVEALRYE